MTTKRKPPSPQEQLAKVYDSLANDVAAGYVETDNASDQHASRVARAAIDKALSSGEHSGSLPEGSSQQEWTKRTDKDEPPVKGPVK